MIHRNPDLMKLSMISKAQSGSKKTNEVGPVRLVGAEPKSGPDSGFMQSQSMRYFGIVINKNIWDPSSATDEPFKKDDGCARLCLGVKKPKIPGRWLTTNSAWFVSQAPK